MSRVLKNSLLFLLLFVSVGAKAETRASFPVDLVFDLDWTLVSPIDASSAVTDSSKVFQIGETRYRISDGVVESLNTLRRIPNVCISYFSGGTLERNRDLLQRIILDTTSGLTAWDILYRKLNFEDFQNLFPNLPSGTRVKFRDRYRKNLSPYFKDLERVVLIDDIREFAAAGQLDNLLWIGKTFTFYDSFRLVPPRPVDPVEASYLPENAVEWEIERNRVPVIALMLEKAILEDQDPTSARQAFLTRVAEKSRIAKTELLREWKTRFPTTAVSCPEFLAPSVH